MRKYKHLIILLILVLTAALLSGCGSDDSGINSSKTMIQAESSAEDDSAIEEDGKDSAEAGIESVENDVIMDIPDGYFTRVGNDEISVAIPIVWKNKYFAVIDENMLMLYQKQALYKGLGLLCSFEIFTDESYKVPYNYDIISQDGERTLIVIYPSDIQFDIEDETSMKEYNEMYKMISQIIKTAKMAD